MAKEITGNPVFDKLIQKAQEENLQTVWDRYNAQQPNCGFGLLGICCRLCQMGPCRIDPFGEGPKLGACGADADIIATRNMVRNIAAGSACHLDHGRDLASTLLALSEGRAEGFQIRDPLKLRAIANEYKIDIENKKELEIAGELAQKILEEFGQQEGELTFAHRAPKKQQDIWNNLRIIPRGIDREIVETVSRTHMGVDNDMGNLLLGGMKAALADGWGGSMIATELSDILFGSPQPIRAQVNLGVLKEDEVNVLVHGHEPTLSDVLVTASLDPELIAYAKKQGAKGINLAGICCTAAEMLVRRGVPIAGNFLQQELAIMTGAIEAMVVDIQCIMPGLAEVSKAFHTKLISTHPKAKFKGMEHIEFREEEALSTAKKILRLAIENYKNRDRSKMDIPKEKIDMIAGFTMENVFHHLGGRFRASYRPLNDNIANGRIRGVAGVVGCDNPRNLSSFSHVELVKELIKNDVLVVQTGCAASACAREGLLTPETAFRFAGDGLKEVCEAVGIPPVLHCGACIDNSRILTACSEMVKEGGIGNGIDELPVVGAAPEWMSEKAIAIGWYFIASGVSVLFGTPLRVYGSPTLTEFVCKDLEKIVGSKWYFESDPTKAARWMIEHLNKKREALKLKPMLYETVKA